MDENQAKEWALKRLQAYVKNSVTKMIEGMLDFSEVAVGDDSRYQALRKKILRLANDVHRNINTEIEGNYEVIYTGIREDVVKVIPNERKGEIKNG